MKIDLISYKSGLTSARKVMLTSNLINTSGADFILFSGWALDSYRDVLKVNNRITNKHVGAVIDVEQCRYNSFLNLSSNLFLLKNGAIENLYTNQIFATSAHVNNNDLSVGKFINELRTNRLFDLNSKKCMILDCGELNILMNQQNNNNKVVFRLPHNKQLEGMFMNILNQVDIIFNPIHSIMGNQNKLGKRREFLSDNKRCYFSAANYDAKQINYRGVHYAYCNKTPILPILGPVIGNGNDYVKRTYNI